jgi:hypothetical protein
MMAPADDNNAMPPQPLVAPPRRNRDSKARGGVCDAKPWPRWVTGSRDDTTVTRRDYRERELHILNHDVARCLLCK